MLNQLYIVIVNWNLKADTLECIKSILLAGARLPQVLVVDNASSDGSVQAIRERYEGLMVIESSKNLGYAGGLNLGIERAIQCGANWLLLINNDTIVAKDFFIELESAVQSAAHVSIFSPLILKYHSPEKIWSMGDRRILTTLLTYKLGRGKIDTRGLPTVLPVDFISGCAMLIQRNVFDHIGLFNTNYFMYAEEIDFCWRAHLAGYRLATATRARMWHKVSASANSEPDKNRYWRIFNQIRFYRQYSVPVQIPGLFIFTFARSLWMSLKAILHGQSSLVFQIFRGWSDGWYRSYRPLK